MEVNIISFVKSALKYAERGWSVIPIVSAGDTTVVNFFNGTKQFIDIRGMEAFIEKTRLIIVEIYKSI